jgi:MFS transporter, DHA2 family, multidrug resistance protein
VTVNDTPRAGLREWVGLAVLALPTLLLALDISVLYLALPHLVRDLQPSTTQTLWILDIYGFLLAGFLVTMGTLGDRIGRRRLLLLGASAFGIASVVAAYSSNPGMLIASRALLGVAGATLMPSTLALIGNMFRDPRQRATAIAVWMSCFVGGTIIGPLVGGLLLEHFWWGSAFLLGVPVMALLLVAAPVLLPEYRDPARAGRVDLTSATLSLAAILPVIYGLKESVRNGWQAPSVAAIVAGVAFGVLFVRRQRALPNPLLDLHLFSHRVFSAALLIGLLVGGVMGGTYLFVTQYLQLVAGLPPLRAGLWLVPSSVATIASSMVAPQVARRVRPGFVMAAGLVVAVLGFVLLTQVGGGGGLPLVIAGFGLIGIGMGPMSLGTNMVIGSAPPEKAGAASAMSETSGELGIALGVAALGSVGTAIYRAHLAIPTGVPAEWGRAAREGLASAITAAQHLPTAPGVELLHSARQAFTAGLTTVAGLGIVLFLTLVVVIAFLLRDVPPSAQAEPEAADHDLDEAPAHAPA